jgi:Tfp pilus assembly protein FimT
MKNLRTPGRSQGGFTLPELMVILVFLGMGTALTAKTLINRAERRADVEDIKSIITLASRRSLVESRHFGVHYDSTLNTFGLFEDIAKDNSFNGVDTLISVVKMDKLAKLTMINSDGSSLKDMCFKKNGTLAPEISFQISYMGRYQDTTRFQVIAASGRVLVLK